jgi:hypothetical protein
MEDKLSSGTGSMPQTWIQMRILKGKKNLKKISK